jgi:uracil-DNA glycosylase
MALVSLDEPSWMQVLANEFQLPYMKQLAKSLAMEHRNGGFFPRPEDVFRAFELTPFEEVRVVILGQDPYHTPGCATGLSFSVPEGVRHPPSLRNVFKERESDLGMGYPVSGDLSPWAARGALLLNSTLTVRPGEARSHYGYGWEQFTQKAIDALSSQREGIVFVLWGRDAQQRGKAIDRERHLIIESAHPSPLSAHNGFFGSRPFSRANEFLAARGEPKLDWSLPTP